MADQIVIPQSQKAAVQELASLSDESFEIVKRTLEEASGNALEPNLLVEQMSKATSEFTKLGGQIVASVVGLRSLVDRALLTSSDVAEGVVKDAESKTYLGS